MSNFVFRSTLKLITNLILFSGLVHIAKLNNNNNIIIYKENTSKASHGTSQYYRTMKYTNVHK